MARYKDEQCRRCRREGQKLFLKGERCYSDKCSISRRNYVPGQHGQKRAKLSEYGTQLREKQKTKAYYGVGENVTGENLLQILESRLDNVVYRLGFGTSRAQARQFVNHAQFEVNGKRVNIPSYLVKPGDVITVRENKKDNPTIKANIEESAKRPVPAWLEKDSEKLSGKVIKLASREDIDIPIEEHLIVEFYSK